MSKAENIFASLGGEKRFTKLDLKGRMQPSQV